MILCVSYFFAESGGKRSDPLTFFFGTDPPANTCSVAMAGRLHRLRCLGFFVASIEMQASEFLLRTILRRGVKELFHYDCNLIDRILFSAMR